jgi:hypothetical protein
MFWVAVAGVGVLGSFGLALVANKTGQTGLQKFRSFTYGVSGS